MTTNDAFLDALDELVEAQSGVLDALRNVRDAAAGADPDDPPPSSELAPPSGFRVTVDEANRRVTTLWAPQDDDVERHERLHPPQETTLRAIVPGHVGGSTSSTLAGGAYEWALRTRRGDAVSEFTEWIRTDIAAGGGNNDDQDDDQHDAGGDQGDDDTPPTQNGPTPLDVLPELATWTVMLPRGSDGDPDNDYAGDWGNIPDLFFCRDGGVVFRCPADGVHSGGSHYPRTEARQMVDTDWTKAAWSSSDSHTLTCELAIDLRGLSTRRRAAAMQIHDGDDDVCQLIYDAEDGLGISHDDGDSWEPIDRDYRDGDRFVCSIHAIGDLISVYYRGNRVVDIPKRGSGWYWKVGAYLQTGGSSEHHEPAGATGEVIVYSLTTTGGAR